MVFQKHTYPDVPTSPSVTPALRRSRISVLLCEQAVADRVRDLLAARGALAAPPAPRSRADGSGRSSDPARSAVALPDAAVCLDAAAVRD